MNKMAIAVVMAAGFSGSVMAQSNVTLYGRVNTSVEFQDNGVIDKTVMRNNSSRWGLRGTEDLGGGLNAFFQLEAGFGSDDGSGAGGFSRESYVGLKSASLGQVKLGRMFSALYNSTLDYIGNFNHDTGTTSEDNLYGSYLINGSVIASNAVEYTSPAFGPVTFALTAAASEGVVNKTYEGVVNYDQGPLHVAAGYAQYRNTSDVTLGSVVSAAASYSFGPVALGIAYEHDNAKNIPNSAFGLGAGTLGKRDAVTFTGQYNVGPSEFHLSVGYADRWKGAVVDTKYLQYTLGYKYKLSKRTAVYAFYFSGDNNNLVYAGTGNVPGLINETFQTVGLGVRHNF
ncbi:MAG TPA: porin [Methylibium sp.]|uniref:porin n=1 Tax=Methylibium sp. TaxID=2067992 RepID=UPI002DB65B6C|nr:porin [Methylibium sp.]HEU4460084.1 porin [Methylibium sp.]